MKHFRTRWAVLIIAIIFLSSCGGSKSSTPASPTPEGTAAGPTALTLTINSPGVTNVGSFPHSGQVGNTATGNKSYYQASVVAGTTYTITLYGLSGDADLWVYDYLPFDFITGPVCKSVNGGTSNEQCVVTPKSNGMMNIEVDGEFALSGATYFISVNTQQGPQLCGTAVGNTCFNFTPPNDFSELASLVQTQTGNGTVVAWNVDITQSATGGGSSIHSGGVTNGQTSCVSYTFTSPSPNPNAYVSFNFMTNSNLNYDLLLFYIDNVLQFPVWSGVDPPGTWHNVMFNTASGTHTYQWCHSNSNTNAGITTPSGAVWVDDIYIQ